MTAIRKYIRLVCACLLAFWISNIIFTKQYITPLQFNVLRLKEDAQVALGALSSIHFELPQYNLISQKIEATPEPTLPASNEPSMAYENIPTGIPSSTPSVLVSPAPRTTPTPRPSNRVPTPTTVQRTTPTTIPPTKAPKPTKGPDIFPIDPALSRPGTTVDEIIALAAQKACAPKEVLRTLASIESGGFFDTVTPRYLLLYNSENWWNSEFITEEKRICSGYAYDGNTGIVFPDSKYPGYKCREGSGSGLGVVGVMSLSPYLFNHYKTQAAKVIGSKNVDRRIIFDSLVMAGMNIKENTKASTCTNWDARTVVKAACSYYGSCGIKDGTYYCATFCRNYVKYGGKDCSSAIAQFAETCWK